MDASPEHQSVAAIRGDVVTLTLMCFPRRPITKASSTSQSTSFSQTKDRDEVNTAARPQHKLQTYSKWVLNMFTK